MSRIHGSHHARAVIATIAAAGALLAAPSGAAEITVVYRFGEPARVDAGGGFTRIEFSSTVQSGRPGEPGYPFRGAAILLPPGEGVSGVRVERRGWRELEGSHLLRPIQIPVPIRSSASRERPFLFDAAAYGVDRWVHPPEPRFTTQFFRGHAIAVGCISPLAYRPKNRAVGWYGEIEITIETAPAAAAAAALALMRTDPETIRQLAAIVDNPEAAPGGGDTFLAASGPDDYEYLIVTRDSLRDALVPFRDHHTRRGMRTRIRSVEQIEALFPGVDTAERIRNAIIHEYVNSGITHVLLAGDSDGPPGNVKPVPHRSFYCHVPDEHDEEFNLPADVYYAALDGDWNADGDGRWGEEGEEDFFPEIAVGRACVRYPSDAARFADKAMLYGSAPVAGQVRRALLLGELLKDHPETWGADELEELVGACTHNDLATAGIPPDWEIATLFDRDEYWNKEDAWPIINGGTHWVAHSGHCMTDAALKFTSSDVRDTKFTNDGVSANLVIIATVGCYAAAFDNRNPLGDYGFDCIAEKMVDIRHCAVAFFGNSRAGFLDPGTTSSTSHLYLREFFDAVFGEGYHTLGDAVRRCKEEIVPWIALSDTSRADEFRYDYYQLTLLGDPALDAWTDTPRAMSVTHPASIDRWEESMVVLAPNVPGALAVLYHDGVAYARGVGTPLGYILLRRTRPFPDSLVELELDVSAHNRYTYRDTIAITGTTGIEDAPPAASLATNAPNPFNPSTVIRFTLDTERFVDLRVYDVAGREVDRLVACRLPAGPHDVTWRPSHLSSGIYLYVLRAGDRLLSGKAVLVR
ncbi:MAG: T9SS type A sorting domain-containing protein [Candidatus Krumholzibacteriota bacterium]|nr:T9SS type A sorting domain-containing protein [Candidatus Krumholzibacteriota bacterium]